MVSLCRQGDDPLVCIYVDSCTIGSLGVCVCRHVVVHIGINDYLPLLIGACSTAWV